MSPPLRHPRHFFFCHPRSPITNVEDRLFLILSVIPDVSNRESSVFAFFHLCVKIKTLDSCFRRNDRKEESEIQAIQENPVSLPLFLSVIPDVSNRESSVFAFFICA